jgi:hypothetical protein
MWSGLTARLGNFTRNARQAIERGTRRVSSAYESARDRANVTAASARSRTAAAAETAHNISKGIHSKAVTLKNKVVENYHHFSEGVQNKLHVLKESLGKGINIGLVGEYLKEQVNENVEALKQKMRRLKMIVNLLEMIYTKNFEAFLMKYSHPKSRHDPDLNWLMQNISTLICPVYLFPKTLLEFAMHKIGKKADPFGVLILKITEIIPLLNDEETSKYHAAYLNMNPKETADLKKIKSLFTADYFNPNTRPNLWSFTNALNLLSQSFSGVFFGLDTTTQKVMTDKLRGFNDDELSEIMELIVNLLNFLHTFKLPFPLPEELYGICPLPGDKEVIKLQFAHTEKCLVDFKKNRLNLPIGFLITLVKSMAVDMHQFPLYKSILVFAMAVLHEIKLHLRTPRGENGLSIAADIWRAKNNMLDFVQPAGSVGQPSIEHELPPEPPILDRSGPNLEPPEALPHQPPPRDSSEDDSEFHDVDGGVEYDYLKPVIADPSKRSSDGSVEIGRGTGPTTLEEGYPTPSVLVKPYSTDLGGRRRRKTRKPRRKPKRKSAYRKRY